jgi:hypothetical protein
LAELKSRNGKLPLEQGWLETWEERRIRWALGTTEKPEVTVPDIQARAGQFLEPPVENDGIEWNNALFKKNVNNCLNANIYSYLETSGGQSSNLY